MGLSVEDMMEIAKASMKLTEFENARNMIEVDEAQEKWTCEVCGFINVVAEEGTNLCQICWE